jgi:DNA-binding transcriptional MerR regulator
MAGPIDLRTVARVTDIPDSTLRFWVKKYGWKPVGQTPLGVHLYDALEVHRKAREHPAFLKNLAEEAARDT